MCSSCADKGLIRVNWSDAPEDYALCLCTVGQQMRSPRNISVKRVTEGFPLWMLWCQRERVDPSRIVRMEDVLTVEELAARGFLTPTAGDDAIAAAVRR